MQKISTLGHVSALDTWPVWFDGFIDEVAIYNRDLSEDEVAANFDAEANTATAVQPSDKLAHTWGAIKVSK